jgi:hypothetical protein
MSCMSPYSMPLWTIFDVVACAVFADPVAAGGSVFDLGGDGLEDVFDVGPCGGIAAGHDGGAEARAFFAAGDAGADEEDAFSARSLVRRLESVKSELPPSMTMSPGSR